MPDAAEPSEWLLDGPFLPHQGLTWWVPVPLALAHPGDTNEAPSSSRLRLCEDGRRLGPVHSEHAAIASAGHGRYSHWGDTLYFSTIDGSDPNINGRRYTVSIMPPAIKLLGFGSCHVSAAVEDLQRRDLADSLWRDPALSNSPRRRSSCS